MNGSRHMAFSRRTALAGGSLAGLLLLGGGPALAQGAAGGHRFAPARRLSGVDHAVVYRRDDDFAGWPHTSGFWNLGGGELLQTFMAIRTNYASPDAISHDNIGRSSASAPMRSLTVRSTDHGRTWSKPVEATMAVIDPAMKDAKALPDVAPVDFLDPELLVANGSTNFGMPDGRSFVRLSRDKGHKWSPPLPLPLEGLHSLSAINSTLVRPDGRALLFMIEVDESGWNRHPVVYASTDNGDAFHFLSFITPKTDPMGAADGDWKSTYRFGGHRWFYPRGYLLPNGRILCVLRCQRDPTGVMWTEVYHSDDGGRTWGFLSRVNDFGAPGSLVVMPDGRLVMVYGYRLMPSGIRAQVSEDGGATWGPELIVREDGGSWDLGYPNAWAMPDGRVGVLYYFNSKDDRVQVNGGVRHIARSIFSID